MQAVVIVSSCHHAAANPQARRRTPSPEGRGPYHTRPKLDADCLAHHGRDGSAALAQNRSGRLALQNAALELGAHRGENEPALPGVGARGPRHELTGRPGGMTPLTHVDSAPSSVYGHLLTCVRQMPASRGPQAESRTTGGSTNLQKETTIQTAACLGSPS